jgi:hypothetical protein
MERKEIETSAEPLVPVSLTITLSVVCRVVVLCFVFVR